jgi:hypothetical protein
LFCLMLLAEPQARLSLIVMFDVTCRASGTTVTDCYVSLFFTLLGTVVEFMGGVLRSHVVFHTTLCVISFTISTGCPMKCRPVSCLGTAFCRNVTIHNHWNGIFFTIILRASVHQGTDFPCAAVFY